MRLGLRIYVFCLAAVLAASARAEMPAGEYTIPIGGVNGLAFPVGDVPEECLTEDGAEVCFSASADTDASGHVTGMGVITIDDGFNSADLDLALDGAVGGSTAKPKAALHVAVTGTGFIAGMDVTFSGVGRVKCKIDRLDPDSLFCKGKAKVCVFDGGDRLGCEGLPFESSFPIERTPFDIQVVVATDMRNVVTGTGDVLIEDAPAYSYVAKGKYKPTADTTNLKLTGTDPAVKTKIGMKKMVLEAGGATSGTIAFKVAGQTGKVVIAP
jgi:hypothetical protein